MQVARWPATRPDRAGGVDEERRLLEAVEAGRDLDELAREHKRSRRALELRLERLRR